ncbi:hypothetical protein DYB28_011524 [Aphanomyces astaci]|uniref:Uncharacterized protein n=1 Tax=Aphanomyces astaci TaxID=112090 RepID=A0A9X8EAD0_APHAT|nr:hypothetical protein DYB28_011524 [Aphanomyces astaci]
MHKQVAWSPEMDTALLHEVVRVEPYDGEYGTLILRWKAIAGSFSTYFEADIPYRSARERYDGMVDQFKAKDKAQLLWGTGSDEEVTEQVQLLQDLIDRRDTAESTKKAKKDKDKKRRESLEVTGSQLCVEAEQRVAKRQRTGGSGAVPTKKKKQEVVVSDQLEFERQKHLDDHAYRMERLSFEKEEQKVRLAQLAESTQRSAQLEKILADMGDLIKAVVNQSM